VESWGFTTLDFSLGVLADSYRVVGEGRAGVSSRCTILYHDYTRHYTRYLRYMGPLVGVSYDNYTSKRYTVRSRVRGRSANKDLI
jgi:hypothetical protein